MHDANLRMARKLNLYPSVTSVLALWPKPALDNYKVEQAILAAITLPRLGHESDDAFAKRVVIDSEAHRKDAAQFGRRLHNIAESIGKGEDLVFEREFNNYVPRIRAWFDENIEQALSTETVVVSTHEGYAGTYDMLARTKKWGTALIDYKTQGVKASGPNFYDTWEYQLVAYGDVIEEKMPGFVDNFVSVIINSATPDELVVKVWNRSDQIRSFKNFQICLNLWKASRNYFPHA